MSTTSSPRLTHARQIENRFKKHVQAFPDWTAIEFGQVLLNDDCREVLRKASLPIDTQISNDLIQLLPPFWRHIYKRGVGSGIPALCRWDPDFIVAKNKEPRFFVEVKSSMTKTGNIAIEISCILAAIVNQKRLGLEQLFVFAPSDQVSFWSYLTLEQMLLLPSKAFDGRFANGSGTPYVLLSKDHLTEEFETLTYQS